MLMELIRYTCQESIVDSGLIKNILINFFLKVLGWVKEVLSILNTVVISTLYSYYFNDFISLSTKHDSDK